MTLAIKAHKIDLDDDLEWFEKADCLDKDVELFFSYEREDIDRAKAICKSCSVRETCLEYALKNKVEYGVWGGLSEDQRKTILKRYRRRKAS